MITIIRIPVRGELYPEQSSVLISAERRRDGGAERRLGRRRSTRVLARFDHRSPELATDPFRVYAKLRERCPLHRSEAWDGFWVVASHGLVEEVAHDDARFCTGQGVSFPHAGNPRPLIPLEIDPPDTVAWRRLLTPLFSPGGHGAAEAEVRAIARDLIDAFAAEGRCDVVREFAEALPARETMRLVGLPEERWRECLRRHPRRGARVGPRPRQGGRRHDRGGRPAGGDDGGPGGGAGRRRHQLPALGGSSTGGRSARRRSSTSACCSSSGGSTRRPR